MDALKQLAAAAAFSSALLGPVSFASAAWDVDTYEDEEMYDLVARVVSVDGTARLMVGCYQDVESKERFLTVYTGEIYNLTVSYAPSVPVTVSAGGADVDLSASFRDFDEQLAVDARDHDDARVVDALGAIRDAAGPIEIAFFETRLTFPVENAQSAVGRVLDACW